MKKFMTILLSILMITMSSTVYCEPAEEVSEAPAAESAVAEQTEGWTITCNISGDTDYVPFSLQDFSGLELLTVESDGIVYEGYDICDVFDIMKPDPDSMILSATVEFSSNEAFMFTLVDIFNGVEAYMIIGKEGEAFHQPMLYANDKLYSGTVVNVVILA